MWGCGGESEPTDILVDRIHTWKQNPSMHLDRDEFAYQGMHGFFNLFQHLEQNGYDWRPANQKTTRGTLTDDELASAGALFINLVSDDRPEFKQREIDAIVDYVHGGGGLFVIADHSNVYLHAERINPFLEPMGIEVMFATAVDPANGAASSWIRFDSFLPHPVTEGVRMASFLSGGPYRSDHGVGFISDQGFADDWDPENWPALVGDFKQSASEPSGPLPVVVAAEYGAGRVVSVGDQNIFGDLWLYMNHNFELATNIFEWVSFAEETDTPLREQLEADLLIGLDLSFSGWRIGEKGCHGAFPFYVNLNRAEGVVARGTTELSTGYDLLVMPAPNRTLDAVALAVLDDQLAAGKPVMLLDDLTAPGDGTVQILQALVPDIVVQGVTTAASVADLARRPFTAADTVVGADPFPVSSPLLAVDGLAVAGRRLPADARCPDDLKDGEAELHLLTVDLGEPLLQATASGQTADIIRIIPVGGGELLLVLQDGFWRNENLGDHNTLPKPFNRDAHEVEHLFVDWLLARYGAG